jgi:hypothetical protein
MDHGTENGASLSEIPAELVVSLDLDKWGPLIRGITGIDGNIPKLDQSALASPGWQLNSSGHIAAASVYWSNGPCGVPKILSQYCMRGTEDCRSKFRLN